MITTALEGTPRVTNPAALMTAEELLVYPTQGKRVELVRGRLVVREVPGMRHGEHAARMVIALGGYLRTQREASGAAETLGRVLTCDSGYTLARNPDTVRGPDVSYVSRDSWSGPLPVGYGEFAPDIAVEIRSPNDRLGAILAKVGDLLDAGTRLVWVIDPARQIVTVYRDDGSQALLDIDDVLDGGEVLPGFAYELRELFAD